MWNEMENETESETKEIVGIIGFLLVMKLLEHENPVISSRISKKIS
jgi:hypothetical protein